MHTGLEIADTLSESLIVVLGHPQFYTRFGFVPSVRYGITSPFPVPDEVFMVRAPQGYQTQYEGKIVYPPAFDGV
jgi:putative acetyltransferase